MAQAHVTQPNGPNSAYEPHEGLIDEVGVAHCFEGRNEHFLAYDVLLHYT